jgi:hypothetical protein
MRSSLSNPPFIVGRKVESTCQQIIGAIFIFLTPPSTVNSQKFIALFLIYYPTIVTSITHTPK